MLKCAITFYAFGNIGYKNILSKLFSCLVQRNQNKLEKHLNKVKPFLHHYQVENRVQLQVLVKCPKASLERLCHSCFLSFSLMRCAKVPNLLAVTTILILF